eukprot:3566807-Pleurochrysis_carterae.AAC.1
MDHMDSTFAVAVVSSARLTLTCVPYPAQSEGSSGLKKACERLLVVVGWNGSYVAALPPASLAAIAI